MMHELFKKRRSIRQYTGQAVNQEQIEQILTAGMVAPSAKNLHPTEFLVVQDRTVLARLAILGPWLHFVKQAPVAIVIIGNPEKSQDFWLVDTSIAAAYLYLEATNQGVATCWANIYHGQTEEGKDREVTVKEILGIPKDRQVICILPIGYSAEKVIPHSEKEYDPKRVHWQKW